jgi:uncharacterized protein (TIGR03382 family)
MRHHLSRSLLPALTLAALASSPAAADPGDVVGTMLLPQGTGQASGVAWDGTDLWVAELRASGDPASENRLLRLSMDGELQQSVVGGATQPLQKIAWAGGALWAVELYTELRALTGWDGATSSWDIPFTQGLTGDPATGRLWLLEGSGSDQVHVVEGGEIVSSFTTSETHAYWWGLAFDGCSLWTVDRQDDDTLLRLHPGTGAVLEELPAPSTKVSGLTFDGAHLIATDTSIDALLRVEIGSVFVDGALCEPGFLSPGDQTEPEDPSEEEGTADDPPAEEEGSNEEPSDEGEEPGEPTDGATGEDPGNGEEGTPSPGEEPSSEGGDGSSTPPNSETEVPTPPTDEPTTDPTDGTVADGEPSDAPSGDSLLEQHNNDQPRAVSGGCACAQPTTTNTATFGAALLLLGALLRRRRRR